MVPREANSQSKIFKDPPSYSVVPHYKMVTCSLLCDDCLCVKRHIKITLRMHVCVKAECFGADCFGNAAIFVQLKRERKL